MQSTIPVRGCIIRFEHSFAIIGMLLLIIILATGCPEKNGQVISPDKVKKGETIFIASGCTKCHSVSGEKMYGPPLNLILGRQITVIRKGEQHTLMPDRKYIIRSMKDPEYEKLVGYENKKMAVINLSDDDIESIADYLIFINTSILK